MGNLVDLIMPVFSVTMMAFITVSFVVGTVIVSYGGAFLLFMIRKEWKIQK